MNKTRTHAHTIQIAIYCMIDTKYIQQYKTHTYTPVTIDDEIRECDSSEQWVNRLDCQL